VMIRASCHCGSVNLEIEAPPTEVIECNCSLCRRYGVLWAYYALDQVRVLTSDPPTKVYVWNGRTTEFQHCQNCGCVTHWSPVDLARNRMAVNARLMDPETLASARIRHLDGADTDEYVD